MFGDFFSWTWVAKWKDLHALPPTFKDSLNEMQPPCRGRRVQVVRDFNAHHV